MWLFLNIRRVFFARFRPVMLSASEGEMSIQSPVVTSVFQVTTGVASAEGIEEKYIRSGNVEFPVIQTLGRKFSINLPTGAPEALPLVRKLLPVLPSQIAVASVPFTIQT